MSRRFPLLRRVTAPAVAPVTLAEAKSWLRYDDDDQDGLIEGLVAGAVDWLDGWRGALGRCLINQEWSYVLGRWPESGELAFPFPDVSSVTVEAILDGANALTAVPDATLGLPVWDGRLSRVPLAPSPPALSDKPGAVRVRFVAGFGPNPSDVPASLREAILIKVADAFRFRESAGQGVGAIGVAGSLDALLLPYQTIVS